MTIPIRFCYVIASSKPRVPGSNPGVAILAGSFFGPTRIDEPLRINNKIRAIESIIP